MISLKVLSHLLAGTYNLIPKALRDNSFTGIRGPVGVVGSGSRTFQTTLSRSSWGTNATHLARDRYPRVWRTIVLRAAHFRMTNDGRCLSSIVRVKPLTWPVTAMSGSRSWSKYLFRSGLCAPTQILPPGKLSPRKAGRKSSIWSFHGGLHSFQRSSFDELETHFRKRQTESRMFVRDFNRGAPLDPKEGLKQQTWATDDFSSPKLIIRKSWHFSQFKFFAININNHC